MSKEAENLINLYKVRFKLEKRPNAPLLAEIESPLRDFMVDQKIDRGLMGLPVSTNEDIKKNGWRTSFQEGAAELGINLPTDEEMDAEEDAHS